MRMCVCECMHVHIMYMLVYVCVSCIGKNYAVYPKHPCVPVKHPCVWSSNHKRPPISHLAKLKITDHSMVELWGDFGVMNKL